MDKNEMDGRWSVMIDKGSIMSVLNFLCDHKVITDGHGYNIISGYAFGYFTVNEFDNGFLLNYDDERNSSVLRKIRDSVKKDGHGWAGKLYHDGKLGFEFTLTRFASPI